MTDSATDPNPVRLVLCLTLDAAGDSADLLEACLGAALPHVDGYVLSCTNLEAGAELVRRLDIGHALPGTLLDHRELPVLERRTACAAEARVFGLQRGWARERTYLLLLEPSMILHVEPSFDKARLDRPAYELRHEDAELRHHALRLVSASHSWRNRIGLSDGWEPGEGWLTPEALSTLWIEHASSGSSRKAALEASLATLHALVDAEPDHPRYVFSLARALEELGHPAAAARWYARHAELSDNAEERAVACYRHGRCLLAGADIDRGASLLVAAFEQRQIRAEPLYALARHYRGRGCLQLAFTFAERALELPLPVAERSFVEPAVYDWQVWEELMLSGYYVARPGRELGLAACERLLARPQASSEFHDYVANNELFYVEPIQAARRGTFSVSIPLREPDGADYVATNPTVVQLGGRTLVNVRLVNYRQERGQRSVSLSLDGCYRTRNVTLDWDFASACARAEHESSARVALPWPDEGGVRGLEDMRWVIHRERVWFTAACFNVPGHEGSSRIVLGRMSAALDAIEHVVPVDYCDARAIEKNWLPWSRNDTLYLIYSYDPCLVLHVEPSTGRALPAFASQPAWCARRLRGSAAPVRIPGSQRWLALVHEVAELASGRVYTHRFIELNAYFELVAQSRPFCFDHKGIEYAAGLCLLNPSSLLISYGWQDRDARWIELELAQVLKELAPLDFGRRP